MYITLLSTISSLFLNIFGYFKKETKREWAILLKFSIANDVPCDLLFYKDSVHELSS